MLLLLQEAQHAVLTLCTRTLGLECVHSGAQLLAWLALGVRDQGQGWGEGQG